MKTKFFNLIILDESGSMGCVTRQTISGCNETIQTIQGAQQQHADTQEHFISIYCFQSGGPRSRYLVKNQPAMSVHLIGDKDYSPFGSTPLNDAIGATLTDLKYHIRKETCAVGSVTIITDGMENASHEYSHQQVRQMIEQLQEQGWNFNFIGANIDAQSTAHSYSIDNHLQFEQSEEGTQKMFACTNSARESYYKRVEEAMADMPCCANAEEEEQDRLARLKRASMNFFSRD